MGWRFIGSCIWADLRYRSDGAKERVGRFLLVWSVSLGLCCFNLSKVRKDS